MSTSKLYVFTLMPFAKEFDDIYQLGIKAACEEVGIYCERVDETHVLGPIYDKITNAINKADIIIADLTSRNPNVYYETGYAHALNKITIHLCQDVKEIPFDLLGFQHIVYSGRIVDLKERLKEKLEWASDYIKNKGKELGTLSFEFYQNGKKIQDIVSSEIETTYRGDGTIGQMNTLFTIDVFNSGATESQNLGPIYIYSGPEIISVSSTPFDLSYQGLPIPSPSDDPTYHFRHKVEFRQKLASSEWVALPFFVMFKEGYNTLDKKSVSVPLKVRLLSESTPIDFPLTLNAALVTKLPSVDIIVDGKAFPEEISATLMKEYSRDGSIETAGFKFSFSLRNSSSQRLKVGPIHVHTTDIVRNFEMRGIILSFSMGREIFDASSVEGYSRRFIKSETADLNSLAYESGEFSFELDARKLHRDMKEFDVRMLIIIFTPIGPVKYPVCVKIVQ